MLALGVPSVGATAPGPVGNINVVVTGAGASAQASNNTTVTAANYRDAVRVSNKAPIGAGTDNGCFYLEVGKNTDGGSNIGAPAIPNITPARVSLGLGIDGISPLKQAICGNPNPILAPAAYPLWEVQTGTPGRNVLVIPPTTNPPNGTAPSKVYGISTFR